jgi:hypothetical protein
MSKKRKGTCVFCRSSGKLTEEDSVPQWVARQLKVLYPHTYSYATHFDLGSNGTFVPARPRKGGSVASIKLPVVCAKCNGKWMGRMENRASVILLPALGGNPISLNREQQKVLAKWGAMKSLIFGLRQPNSSGCIKDIDLEEFHALNRIPPDFRMWLAHFPDHESDFFVHGMRDNTWSRNSYDNFPAGTTHAQVLTLVFGVLVVKTVYVCIRGRPIPISYDRPQDDNFTVQIWPIQSRSVQWPPSEALDEETYVGFVNRGIPSIKGVAHPPASQPTKGAQTPHRASPPGGGGSSPPGGSPPSSSA